MDGVKALMDPETSTSGFYLSLVTHPTLTTTMVVGGAPRTFVVPGGSSRPVVRQGR